MQISKISQAMQGELRKIDGTGRKQDKEQAAARKAGITDRSELSAHGKMRREAMGDIQIISSMVRAQPDVRAEKIAEAQAKMSSGFYNSGDFVDKLAAKLAAAYA